VGLHTDHSAFVLAGVWPQASDVIGVVDVKQLPLGTSLEELGTSLEEVAGEAAKIARDNRALAVFEDCYGPGHFEVAQACANLAVLHADQGHFAAAEGLGRRSLHIFEILLGPDDAEAGLTMLNLAAAVAGQGRRAEAAALAERAAQILAARLPAGHPHLHAARETLAHLQSTS